jgi:pyruvate kinase
MNKTKIICTLGPASNSVEILTELIQSGMDAVRLNFSHGSYEQHTETINNVRQAILKTGVNVPIIQDLQGPKIRVGKLENGYIEFKTNQEFYITSDNITGNQEMFSTTYGGFVNDVNPDETILIDDGLIRILVQEKEDNRVKCKVIKGGIVKEKKGINLPGTKLSLPSLTEKDLLDIDFGLSKNIDVLALSFVRHPDDITNLRKIIVSKGFHKPIIAKIERPEAIEYIDAIIDVSDIIMVARGDLGVEVSPEQVPVLQKLIIRKSNQRKKPVITATQMLESMINNRIPTRAEASDVANAILDGSDCVMLSAETSVGVDPVNVVSMMSKIIDRTEQIKKPFFGTIKPREVHEQLETLCEAAAEIAEKNDIKMIITYTKTGNSPKYLSGKRIKAEIIAVTNRYEINSLNSFLWGVYPVLINQGKAKVKENEILGILKNKNILKSGEKILVIYNSPDLLNESANTLSVLQA